MFETFKKKTKEEKKEVIKTAGKITLGVIGAGALGYFLGFKNGVDTFLEFGLKLDEQKLEHSNEDKEEGEA